MSQAIAVEPSGRAPSRLRSVRLIATMTVASLLARKRLIFLFLLLSLPPFISVVMKAEGAESPEQLALLTHAFFLVLAPMVSLFHGTSVFSDEVDGRTLGYLLLRPISRECLLFGKMIGVWMVSLVLLSFSSVATHLPYLWTGAADELLIGGKGGELAAFFGVLMLATAIYAALSTLFGLILKHPMLVGIGYMLIVEALFCYAPGPPSKISISYYLMRLLPERYVTPEEIVGEEMNVIVAEPSVGLILLALAAVLAGLIALNVAAVRSSDFSVGEED